MPSGKQLRQLREQPELLPVAGSEVLEDRRAGVEGPRLLILPAKLLSRNLQASKLAVQYSGRTAPFQSRREPPR